MAHWYGTTHRNHNSYERGFIMKTRHLSVFFMLCTAGMQVFPEAESAVPEQGPSNNNGFVAALSVQECLERIFDVHSLAADGKQADAQKLLQQTLIECAQENDRIKLLNYAQQHAALQGDVEMTRSIGRTVASMQIRCDARNQYLLLLGSAVSEGRHTGELMRAHPEARSYEEDAADAARLAYHAGDYGTGDLLMGSVIAAAQSRREAASPHSVSAAKQAFIYAERAMFLYGVGKVIYGLARPLIPAAAQRPCDYLFMASYERDLRRKIQDMKQQTYSY